jgi:Zn finger protein HypA/HybF involved in hydrogenase expression
MSLDDERRKDHAIERLETCFHQIRERTDFALKEIAEPREINVRSWKCAKCGSVMNFTRPVSIRACDVCPKCKGKEFKVA